MSKAKVKVAGIPGTDPTLPRIEFKRGKETFYLCFNFRALAIAQKNLRLSGVECNLLKALDLSGMDAERIVPVFYATLITHQPDITIEQVENLIDLKNIGLVFNVIADAYVASLAEPSDEDEKPDPLQPE
jgi:hypothetical protein